MRTSARTEPLDHRRRELPPGAKGMAFDTSGTHLFYGSGTDQGGYELYQHVWKGGGTQVVKLGPKEAKIEVVGFTALTIPYFRNAMLGMHEAAIGLSARRVHVRHLPSVGFPLEQRFVLHIRWD